MFESAETSDIGDVVGDINHRSVVAVDKTQPVFVVISNSSGMTMIRGTDSVPCFATIQILK